MKLIFASCLFVSSTAFGQLYSSYSTEGIGKTVAGPVRGKAEIFLNSDSSFTVIQKIFFPQEKRKELILWDSSASVGRWRLQGKILRLDFRPDSVFANKIFDTYLIKKKGLRRTTLKHIGITTKYKASGQLLEF